MKSKIEPKILKGFRDFLPEEYNVRKKVFQIFENTFKKYGFEGLETPALEYFDILMGKYGEEEKLVYNFEDFGGREVALKYDLTVPTARVIAMNQDKIKMPFKRYQIQPVWRADNTQKGRFREFYQCDVDVFGSNSKLCEAELMLLSIELLKELGFKEFVIMINNRKILNAIAKYAGAEDKFFEIVYAIDKWTKRTPAETKDDLIRKGLAEDQVDKVFDCLSLKGSKNSEKLNDLETKLSGVLEGRDGIEELRQIIDLVDNEEVIKFTPTIARGLAYYTGPVYEILILDGNVGSVAGGGRYDEMIGSMTGGNTPAVGISFGIERIMEIIKERNMLEGIDQEERAMVLNIEGYQKECFDLANRIRQKGESVFMYPEAKKIGKQLEYAAKQNFTKAYILGEEEISNNEVSIKDLKTGEQTKIAIE